ncbi:MAG: hypothetical protein Ct9H90mP16_18050 [Candidatus Poseidoniales archaeon]|nr:MAG: hypothetical protein Ct9H90mP16_18050 [Candidatus Poseidoniales archaeon]
MSVSIVRSSPLVTRKRPNKRSYCAKLVDANRNYAQSETRIRVEDLVPNRPIGRLELLFSPISSSNGSL